MEEARSQRIYLDHHATTPVDPRVVEAMLPYFTDVFGNASSVDHVYGAEAKHAVDEARGRVAQLLRADPAEVIFTSGATESNNLAIKGVAESLSERGKHIITCATEHPAVLDTCADLEVRGWQVTYLPVAPDGLVDPSEVARSITAETVLISIMAANNETGVLSLIQEIGEVAREHDVLFHTDATQAVPHVEIDVSKVGVDLLSLSGHKMYGPKGVGALYVRRRSPRIKLHPQLHGGGHERKFRSGTLNVPGIVGLGAAAALVHMERSEESNRVAALRRDMWEEIQERVGRVNLHGHEARRLPNSLNFAVQGVESRSVIAQVRDRLAISTGSACATLDVEPSHVLLAMGFDEEEAHSTLRIGLGRFTTEDEVVGAVELLARAVSRARRLAP